MKNNLLFYILNFSIVFSQSTDQLKQAKTIIEQSGMSESQVIKAAKERGYNDAQIKGAKRKAAGLENKNKNSQLNDQSIILPKQNKSVILNNEDKKSNSNSSTSKEPDLQEIQIIDNDQLDLIDEVPSNIESKTQSLSLSARYFGYEIFEKDPEIFQAASVGAVDTDYLIGPGDEIIVMLWGETQFRQVLTVNREGFIFIPEIGQVFVNGLNLNLLESKLFRVLSQSYASLNPNGRKATTFLDISLGNLRPLRIQVLGEVSQPGAYTVNPSATLFSTLYYFNGPTNLGSLRDIRLIRNGEQITSIDFYDYLLTGKKPKDLKLQLDDVVFIPKRMKTVTISGEVNRPGIYELKESETLRNLISMAGDLKITAYLDRAQIDRIVSFKDREILGMDRVFNDVNLNEILKDEDDFKLQDGDKIQIFSVLDLRQNFVDIRGAVARPGSYDIGSSLRLSELILKADSLLGDAYMDRVDVVRTKPDFNEELIKLNLNDVMQKDEKSDILLSGLDRVRVYGKSEMIPKTYVSIRGHVKQEGRYLLQENMTLYDLIFKSGGYSDPEFKKRTYLKRAELVRTKEYSDDKEIIPFDLGLTLNQQDLSSLLLKTDDAVRIYSLEEIEGNTRYVTISGHVKRPGRYELYEGNMTLYDLIFKSGGYSDSEFKKSTYLERSELVRYSKNKSTREIIPFNLQNVIENKGMSQTLLKVNDEVKVYSVEEIEGESRFVSIKGHVKNPGSYELYEENMTISDLIFKSGGLRDEIFKGNTFLGRADLIRFEENRLNKKVIPFNLGFIINNEKSDGDFRLIPGDEIIVYSKEVFNSLKNINIDGAVREPGSYEFKLNMTLKDLILEAGGFSENVYRYRVEIARIDPIKSDEFNFSEIIFFEMDNNYQVWEEDVKSDNINYNLMPYDNISIRPDPYFSLQKKVAINGAVYYPGVYAISNSEENLADLIIRAGGLRPRAYGIGSTFIRSGKSIQLDIDRIVKKPKSKNNIILSEGDEIFIATRPNIIEVFGEVNTPGLYKYEKGLRVRDVIKDCGGFTPDYDRKNIFIKYPNGISKVYKYPIRNPKVLDGSEIHVAKRKESDPIDYTEYAKELTTIIANFVQVISIIILAR